MEPTPEVPSERVSLPVGMSLAQRTFLSRLGSTLTLWGLIIVSMAFESSYGFFAIIFVLALVGLREYFAMVKLQGTPVFTLTGMLCAATYMLTGFLYQNTHGNAALPELEVAMLAIFLLVVFGRQMWRKAADRAPLEAVAYTFFGLFYIPWMFTFMTKILFLPPRAADGAVTGQYYLVFLLVATKFSDMGAYVFGSLFGRHPFAPHISPKKTWEGFLGALVTALLGSVWIYALMPGRLSALRFGDVVVLGVLLGATAVVGDLAESIIKRSTQTKDSSRALPGIGGALDLIDSLLFTAPLMYFYLRIVAGA